MHCVSRSLGTAPWNPGERVYVRRCYIDRKECRGTRFYFVFTLSGSFSRYLIAADRDAARRFIEKQFPSALFWR